MFASASSFDQDLSCWNVSNIATKPTSFDATTTAWNKTNRQPVWGSDGSACNAAEPIIMIFDTTLDGNPGNTTLDLMSHLHSGSGEPLSIDW